MPSFNVRIPSGHSKKIVVENSQLIQDIVFGAANAFKINPSEYKLQFQNQILDMTMPIRWSRLPNNCNLELVLAMTAGKSTLVKFTIQGRNASRSVGFDANTPLIDCIKSVVSTERPDDVEIKFGARQYTGQSLVLTLAQTGLSNGTIVSINQEIIEKTESPVMDIEDDDGPCKENENEDEVDTVVNDRNMFESMPAMLTIDERLSFICNKSDFDAVTNFNASQQDVTDEELEVTTEDIRTMYRLQDKVLDQPLRFRSRPQVSEAESDICRRCSIRVSLTDNLNIQALFHPQETVTQIYHLVKFYLGFQVPFSLFITPPKRILKHHETLESVGLTNGGLVRLKIDTDDNHDDLFEACSSSMTKTREQILEFHNQHLRRTGRPILRDKGVQVRRKAPSQDQASKRLKKESLLLKHLMGKKKS